MNPIEVEGLKKDYGAVAAVKGVDFEVRPGEVFGLLGPNGAGKTTTVEILEGLRSRTSGRVQVLGFDPEARLEIHDLVQNLRSEQRTILLTTHYIEEAEKLCDRVAIIDEGRIIAIGSPREIQEGARANSTIELLCAQPVEPDGLPAWRD